MSFRACALWLVCLCALQIIEAQFPKEKDPAEYKYNINTRYKELVPLLDSATYTAEKFMNRTGFFNLMGGMILSSTYMEIC